MKSILLSFFLFVFTATLFGQKKIHKIVYDISSADTADHSGIVRQIKNILKEAPTTKIEVVFHGKAIYALVKNKTTVQEGIEFLVNEKHILVAACNNSMKRLEIKKEELLPVAFVVPVAILELTYKQEQGWSYIRSGH